MVSHELTTPDLKSERRVRHAPRFFNMNRLTPYFFLAPAGAVLAVALLYPIGYMIYASFLSWNPSQRIHEADWIGLRNYTNLLKDPNFIESFFVTLKFASVVVTLEMVIGVGLALLLDRKIRGMSVLRTIFILPMMIAPIVVGLMWRYMYHPSVGILNRTLKGWGLDPIPWLSDPDWALPSVIIADVWQWTPFIFILSLAALQSLPQSALEASRIDGASTWQQIIHIKLPLMLPVLIIAGLLRLIDAFKVLEVILVLTNGGPGLSTEILSLRISRTTSEFRELGEAAAMSNYLLLLLLIITLGMFLFNKVMDMRQQRLRAAAQEAG
ncbi:sugar ABC transporter permease [Nitratireductor sp. XY-223]|uniref:carbohydrate ABC transporter permease n=1 Tax=Nitratireductor sp. XY-223 TaxID=2561926 RepID=UPI001FEE682F|nr:sugar ABC transporter permease [Nitratireductor sp. XY-223]